MTMENKVLLYTAVLRPILSYGSPVWGYAAKSNSKTLEICQNKTIRMIVHARQPIKCQFTFHHRQIARNLLSYFRMNFFQLRLSINRTSLLRLNESQAVSPQQGLLLFQAQLTSMIWDGGSLREPYAQRHDNFTVAR
ncbi:hypothetical protein TNCV_3015201 [Trichonephila clavipes]|nr:hypothetical protein TNCV_3015201 [Trichonephila clavipes]